MLYRNLMAMDTEEMIRAQPLDAVVLLGGCDKTMPAQLMGAASADMPAILLAGGPMLTGRCERPAARRLHRLPPLTGRATARASSTGERIGRIEAARADAPALHGDGHGQHDGLPRRGAGHEPARHRGDPGRPRRAAALAEATGAAADGWSRAVRRRRDHDAEQAFENALRVLLAIGGSTNALVHLTAIAGRLGIPVDLER